MWNINRGSPTREPTALTVFNDGVHERLFASYFGVWAFDRSAPQPGVAATIDMWTDPLEGPIYANGLNGVMYDGLVRDEKLNWGVDSTPVTVTYDMSQLTGEILRVVKRTKNGIVRGGVLGVINPSGFSVGGVATATLTSSSGWGTAIVTASVGEFSDQVQVQVIPIKVMLPLIIK